MLKHRLRALLTPGAEVGPAAVLGRVLLLLLAAFLLLLGVIGLLLPIIPGIVFLGLAALVLARLSTRFADYLRHHPHYRRWHDLRRSSATLNWSQRCKLALLLGARSIVNTLDGAVSGLGRRRSWGKAASRGRSPP